MSTGWVIGFCIAVFFILSLGVLLFLTMAALGATVRKQLEAEEAIIKLFNATQSIHARVDELNTFVEDTRVFVETVKASTIRGPIVYTPQRNPS